MYNFNIFVEGLTEAAFVDQNIKLIFKNQDINIDFVALGSISSKSPPPFKNLSAKLNFLIIDVGGDGSMLSSIKDREKKMFEQGCNKIIGLQDLRTDEYDKKSGRKIKKSVSSEIINNRIKIIDKMTNSKKISLLYSVMEIESWFIAMPDAIYKIDAKLNRKNIKKKLGVDLEKIISDQYFYKPSDFMKDLYKLCSKKYDKSLSCALSLCKKINKDDLNRILTSKNSPSYILFYNELTKDIRSFKN